MAFLEIRQQLKLTQQLVMTPQLQQAIKLLQLSRLELADTIQQEIEQNPLLEEEQPTDGREEEHKKEAAPTEQTAEVNMESQSSLGEIDWSDYVNEYETSTSSTYLPRENNDQPSVLDILSQKATLRSHLQWQLSLANLHPDEFEAGIYILGNLNQDGFLKISSEELEHALPYEPSIIRKMIKDIQDMDPAGVGARDVRECLLLQLKRLNLEKTLPYEIVNEHLSLLETRNYKAIGQATKESIPNIVNAVNIITGLDPHPGRAYLDENPHYITPDVYIQKIDGEYVILLNDEGLPRLKISRYYREILKKSSTEADATKDYIREKLKSAAWLIKSIQQRQQTIYKVVESILKFQHSFFEKGVTHMRPMVLRDVAEDIDMHESTISRVTTNKYVHSPQGTFELKFFFTSAIEQKHGEALSSQSIKARIRQIIQEEDPERPLSDKSIADIFQNEEIKLARRTVAKYREQLGILSSKYRKRPKLT